jgi:hypothetical protein
MTTDPYSQALAAGYEPLDQESKAIKGVRILV